MEHTAYCPRCDKKYSSTADRKSAFVPLRKHIADNHPEMLEAWDDEQPREP